MSRLFRFAALGVLIPAIALAQSAPNRPAPERTPMVELSTAPFEAGSPIRSDTVYLAAGQLRSLRHATVDELRGEAAAATLDVRHVIQLDGPLTPDQRAAMEKAGVVLHDYLPSNAYIAELAATDADAFAQLPFVRSATPIVPAWKLSPELGRANFTTFDRKTMAAAGRSAVLVTLFPGEDPAPIADLITRTIPNTQVFYANRHGEDSEISVALNAADVTLLADIPAVQFVEPAPELTFRNSTTTWIAQSNQTNMTPVYSHGIHGENQVVGVMDGKIDQNHCAFANGKILFYNTSAGTDSHGTHTSCTAAGNNASLPDLRGIAYEAHIVFDDIPAFTDAGMYDTLLQHHNQGARVHTNSWGDDGTTSYNALCRGNDRFSYDYEDSLVMFAVTNLSALKNPDNAKNILAVGASQDTPNQGSFCSGGTGPTVDGRRKPEVFLPGCNTTSARSSTACSTIQYTGTSMASPAVTGSAALVRQYYTDGFYPTGAASGSDAFTPTGALVKATIINSATDMTGIAGYPSNQEGWGRVLLDDTLHFTGDTDVLIVRDIRNASGLSTAGQNSVAFNVAGSGERLRVTLVWTDPPASASTGAAAAWINNLDLEVVDPNGNIYKGNVISSGVSTIGGTADDRNNVEQVILPTPSTGGWLARVKGTAVNQGTQGFALVISGDVNEGPAPLQISLDTAVPSLIAPQTPVNITATVTPGDDTLVPGSVTLHYAADGSTFTDLAMSFVSGTTYAGTIPGFESCDDTPAFYVSAEGASTGVVSAPVAGASAPYTFALGVDTGVFADNMETDMGWTVNALSLDNATTGIWNRMDPQQVANAGLISQPENDTTAAGTLCWVTDGNAGAAAGDFDVDNGSTSLYSPILDLSGADSATMSYQRWYSNHAGGDPGNDVFTVQVSSNGSTWVTAQTIGPSSAFTVGGWFASSFVIDDFVPLTSTVRVRFIAADAGTGSLVEAAIDDVSVAVRSCVIAPPACVGDITGDGITNSADFNVLASNFGTLVGATHATGDLTGDGAVNSADFNVLAGDFGCGGN